MGKVLSFAALDILSLKNGFGIKALVIFATISVGGWFIMGLDGISFGGTFIIPLIATQAFTAGNNGLDRFYVTLSLSRKDVLLGRYTFVSIAMLTIIAFYFAVGGFLMLFTDRVTGLSHLPMLVSVYFLANLITSITLPFLFGLGFKRARPITHFLPLKTILLIMLIERQLANGLVYSVVQILGSVSGGLVALIVIVTSLMIFGASMLISMALYKKREL
ncbi:MAG: ABC-2 transporter permease [Defluviitaleaceae bacterium]|nr:ABC-2 transporter permease [Defluviitaleaceae bacterium]